MFDVISRCGSQSQSTHRRVVQEPEPNFTYTWLCLPTFSGLNPFSASVTIRTPENNEKSIFQKIFGTDVKDIGTLANTEGDFLEKEIENLNGRLNKLHDFIYTHDDLRVEFLVLLKKESHLIAIAPNLAQNLEDDLDPIQRLAHLKKTKSILEHKLKEEIFFIKRHPDFFEKFFERFNQEDWEQMKLVEE